MVGLVLFFYLYFNVLWEWNTISGFDFCSFMSSFNLIDINYMDKPLLLYDLDCSPFLDFQESKILV
jgi:hypothetical protein